LAGSESAMGSYHAYSDLVRHSGCEWDSDAGSGGAADSVSDDPENDMSDY
jgi:hypothetical protein